MPLGQGVAFGLGAGRLLLGPWTYGMPLGRFLTGLSLFWAARVAFRRSDPAKTLA